MQTPEIPANESDRQAALNRYKILDTLPEQVYDDLTQLAADICGTPIALISLVDKDRQWFKSRVGLDATEIPRDISFCGHAVAANAILNVPDARQDPRFADNPLVASDPNIRFYAGVPLITHDNYALGTLCAIDHQPRDLTDLQLRQLEVLSRLVINQFDLRIKERTAELQQAIAELKQENQERLKIEESLRESQKRFESLASVAPVGIYRTNTTGDCIYVNDRWCQIAGLTAAEAAGPNWARALHPEDREKVAAEWYTSVQENRPFELECRFQKPDGTVTWVLSRASAERDIYGEIIGYVGTITDISDRKRAETILQKLVTGTAAVTGADFFEELVRHIAEALDVTYALVTEFVSDHLVTLGFWANGSLQPSISYVPAKTPCEISLQKGQYHCEQYVAKIFAEDLDLVTMQAESYLGIALKDDQGNSIGNLCVLDTQPISEIKKVEAIGLLQVFAARASAELQRKNVNEALYRLNQDLEMRVQQRTQELQERERFLQTVLDSFPLAVFWKDRQSVLLGCNQIFASSSGLESPLEVIGKTNFDFSFTEEEALKFLADDQSVMESGLSKIGIEESYTSTNGEINWIETNKIPLRDASGEIVGIVGTFQDINDRKQAELQLQKTTERLALALKSGAIGCWEWNVQQNIGFWDERMYELYGLCKETDSQIVCEILANSIHPDDRAANEMILQKIATGQIDEYDTEFRVVYPDGSIHFNKAYGTLKRDANGNPLSVTGINFDISDRKQAEAQLQKINDELLRATRLKDEFLANMSHELRTPLNSILGMNEALQEEVFGRINERQLKALRTIESSSTHLLALINDILDVAKIESGQVTLELTATDLDSLCKSSMAFIKQQALTKRIQLIHRIPKYLPEIMLDETRIRQVLINLLNNAVKFTMEGGTITLEVSQVQLESSASNLTPINYLKIAVIDTGIGISSENIQKLFQPFIQIDSALNRQYNGTGLGLALVRKLVELHGGNVELTSELGVGSCFAINLPINIGSPLIKEQPEQDLSGQPQIGQSQTEGLISPLILLAEDNEANITTFSTYLEAKGYRIVLATDGQQAINLAKAEHPDLILMDIQMPIMNGLEATKQIRLDPNLTNIPIIALTALAMAGDREKCLAAGANEYMSKPFRLRTLANTIQELLRSLKLS